jgi:DNA-binding transcriptional LysR family regulator
VTSGGLYAWELEHEGRRTEVKVTGQAVFTSVYPMIQAAVAGHGLAFLTLDLVQRHVDDGTLERVMPEWCPHFPGLHAYYTSRRHPTRALATVIDALRMPAA